MIPKIIHYCWFGGKPLPELAKKCIESWKKYCPDYELKLWNEENFDLNSNPYIKEAYDAKKFAFVTDYVRLWVLYQYGGIYMDTDVEVLKPLDRFLIHPAFSGFESPTGIPTGIMASEKNGKWAERELEYYKDRHFLKADGTPDLTTNVAIITNNLVKDGFLLNNTYQEHKGIIVMYPMEYFCPRDEYLQPAALPESYTIHHFLGSWCPPHRRIIKRIKSILRKTAFSTWLLHVLLKIKNGK